MQYFMPCVGDAVQSQTKGIPWTRIEADKERSKKICLERSAAKTLLTLHRHTGKSKEEHEAAGTLLDLSLESVVSAEEAEFEDLQEVEEQVIDQFPEPLPDDEPIDSHVDRDTQTDKKMLRECGTQVRHLLSWMHFPKCLHLNHLFLIYAWYCQAR